MEAVTRAARSARALRAAAASLQSRFCPYYVTIAALEARAVGEQMRRRIANLLSNNFVFFFRSRDALRSVLPSGPYIFCICSNVFD